jgi:hypothetical protein
LAFILGNSPCLSQGIASHIDRRVIAARSAGIEREKCWGDIIENLHVFSGLAKKNLIRL